MVEIKILLAQSKAEKIVG